MWIAPVGGRDIDPLLLLRTPRGRCGLLYDPPGHSRIGDVRWSAIFSFVVGAVAAWCFEYGEVGWLMGPAATALHDVDLTWLVGSVVAGVVYLVIGRPSRSSLFSKTYKPAVKEVGV